MGLGSQSLHIINSPRVEIDGGDTWETHQCQQKAVLRLLKRRDSTRLFRSRSTAFCLNYTEVRLYCSGALFRVNDQRWRIDKLPLRY